ncbi:MAG: hypothetical protein DIZ78_17635 [endosymbiont of Escarpia spicata]|uniref:Uncharacterized protein n=1 Tax=endosymbiont of Escarpia spicata TaxID=2200908 RepID=A0A370DA24_9GAMM|nr:MAG: hypothetical protein DIZ78_17635 [endosymbiont of Escarpia spicata]
MDAFLNNGDNQTHSTWRGGSELSAIQNGLSIKVIRAAPLRESWLPSELPRALDFPSAWNGVIVGSPPKLELNQALMPLMRKQVGSQTNLLPPEGSVRPDGSQLVAIWKRCNLKVRSAACWRGSESFNQAWQREFY